MCGNTVGTSAGISLFGFSKSYLELFNTPGMYNATMLRLKNG